MSDNRSPEEIREEIQETRERLSEEIDELGYRLSPERVRERARERLEDAQRAVTQTARDLTDTALTRAESAGHALVEQVEEHPIAASLLVAGAIGAGVGWVLWQNVFQEKQHRSEVYVPGARTAGPDRKVIRPDEPAGTGVVLGPSGRVAKAYEPEGYERRAGGGLGEFVKEHAVAVGLGTVVAGVAAALLVARRQGEGGGHPCPGAARAWTEVRRYPSQSPPRQLQRRRRPQVLRAALRNPLRRFKHAL